MKKWLLFACVWPALCFAQVEDWYKCDLSRLGYKHNVLTFENAPNGETALWQNDPYTRVKGGSWELSVDLFTRHVYFGFDGSFLLDAGTRLFQFKSKERWFNNKEYSVDRGDLLPVKLAFGTNIGRYVSVYAGGQYQYTTLGISYKDNSGRRDVYIGGNQRGAGIHLVAAYKWVHLRYSFMYDWIRSAKTYTGKAMTSELALHLGAAKFGGFMKINRVYREMNGGYLPDSRDAFTRGDLSSTYRMLPAEYATQFTFSIGVYAAGLFSGVTKAGSKALYDTETGVREERNRQKRSRIEYKD